MDEKGFLIGIITRMKRIFSQSLYKEGAIKQLIQDGNREWITTIACICADGTSLSPGLIYQATSGNIQDTWLQDFDPMEHQCFFASSPSGWTNEDLGYQWLTQIFDKETKEKARRKWRLLILDGHGSHINMRFINYCDAHKILLAVYPPHSTHTLQPLDVALFKPLSSAYSSQLSKFMEDCQGLTSMTKRDFFCMFWQAWKLSFTLKNILSGFSATGLVHSALTESSTNLREGKTNGLHPVNLPNLCLALRIGDALELCSMRWLLIFMMRGYKSSTRQ